MLDKLPEKVDMSIQFDLCPEFKYSGRRLIGSLWAMSTLIPRTEF
jgi:hypothetical protein